MRRAEKNEERESERGSEEGGQRVHIWGVGGREVKGRKRWRERERRKREERYRERERGKKGKKGGGGEREHRGQSHGGGTKSRFGYHHQALLLLSLIPQSLSPHPGRLTPNLSSSYLSQVQGI